jgi:ubiquinol-cytochrome c reductase cytochrome b subunit
MKKNSKTQNKSVGLVGWVDERFPLSSFIKNHLTEYYAPKNFNFWYFFGALALFVFAHANINRYFSNDVLQA